MTGININDFLSPHELRKNEQMEILAALDRIENACSNEVEFANTGGAPLTSTQHVYIEVCHIIVRGTMWDVLRRNPPPPVQFLPFVPHKAAHEIYRTHNFITIREVLNASDNAVLALQRDLIEKGFKLPFPFYAIRDL